jgi:hypothetical protein
MDSNDFLDRAKHVCGRLVEKIFPEESTDFEEIWDALLPIFEKWQRMKPGRRRFAGVDLSLMTGLGFGDARDWGIPIVLLTTLVTMLEICEASGYCTESDVRTSVRKCARSFGAPENLRELLEDKVPPFCLQVYRDMEREKHGEQGMERKRKIEEAMPERRPEGDYILLTHRKPERPLTLQQLVNFKKQHTPKDFFIWIDESQGEVFVNNKSLGLENHPRLRRVLRCLVELQGQCITHKQLVKMCGKPRKDYVTPLDKLSRSWVIELKKAGTGKRKEKGKLAELIKSRPGGFAYESSASFCIIKPTKELR